MSASEFHLFIIHGGNMEWIRYEYCFHELRAFIFRHELYEFFTNSHE
jgi:hypothetical protein